MDANLNLNTTLQEMIDHHEIRKMLTVYCHGCDRGDGPRMKSVYGEDSWDDHGLYKGPGLEYPKMVMDSIAVTGQVCSHLLGQSQIKVTDDTAGAETYFLASIREQEPGGQEVVTLLSGRYVDTLKREGGAWKVDKRTCVRDWSITLDINKDTLRDYDFVQGKLSGQDPSYAVLGLQHPGFPWPAGQG